MGKKDAYLFIAGTAIETIGMGLGMAGVISSSAGIGIAVIGGIVFLYAVYRVFTIKPVYPTWQELQARGEAKRWYLEPLRNSINELIAEYKEQSEKAIRFPLEDYNSKYFRLKAKSEEGVSLRDIILSA